MFTNGMDFWIGDSLTKDGFKDIRDVPVEILEKKIVEFLKVRLYIKGENIDLKTILEKLKEYFIMGASSEKDMGHICFYILWYIGMLQGYTLSWQVEEEPTTTRFVESEFFEGKLDKLVTSMNIDYIDTIFILLNKARELKENLEVQR